MHTYTNIRFDSNTVTYIYIYRRAHAAQPAHLSRRRQRVHATEQDRHRGRPAAPVGPSRLRRARELGIDPVN